MKNKIAYTVFIAFCSVMLTLTAVYILAPEAERDERMVDGLPIITMEELARHDSAESCWKAIHGKVYDVTDYIPHHPTRPTVILRWCGSESTRAWETSEHGHAHSNRAAAMLEDYLIGRLAKD